MGIHKGYIAGTQYHGPIPCVGRQRLSGSGCAGDNSLIAYNSTNVLARIHINSEVYDAQRAVDMRHYFVENHRYIVLYTA